MMRSDENMPANISLFDWKQQQETIEHLQLQVSELQAQVATLRELVASLDLVVRQIANYHE